MSTLSFKEFVGKLNAINTYENGENLALPYEPNRGGFDLYCPTCDVHHLMVRCKAILMYYNYVKGCAHCHGPIVLQAVDKPLEGDSVVVYTHI